MATITGNVVHADPDQWFTLDYTFANSKFTWSVTAHASHTSYWNTIYGLTVNVGGNSYYKGDISWQGYTPNTVVYSGTTNLSDCTISNGQVTLSVSGNFYYGTWSSDYTSSGSGQCAVNPPTVASLTYTATNKYGSTIVANRSVITFTLKGTSQTGSNSITYALYQGSTLVGTASGTSGTAKTINVTAPAQGTYLYKYTATDGNGTTNTSGTVSVSTQTYTPPSFNSVSAVRWTTGTSSGTASDEGTYCKATASWNVGKVGSSNLTTTLKVTVNSTSSTTTTNGASLYMGGGNLSPDSSYTVTFKLYDSYTGEANGVVRTDTLTMGGRGLDFIYANGHYGVAVGQKATANRFDTNLPSYIEGVRYGNTSNYTNLGGGSTVTGQLHTIYGFGRSASNGSSTSIYMPIFKFVTTRTYQTGTLRLTIGGRSMPITNIFIQMEGGSETDPTSATAWVDNNIDVYLCRVSANNWTVYVKPVGVYQQMDLFEVRATNYFMQGTTISATSDAGVTSVPSGAIKATVMSQTLVSVTNTVTRSSGLSINWQGFRVWGRVACLELKLNGSGSSTAGSNIFTGTLPSYRPIFPAKTAEFYGAGGFIGSLDENGAITIRAISSVSLGTTLTFTWTYLWA